jgi:hypothetical protein
MTDHRQRQRHGVVKNLAEGVGGVVVGAALVVLVRGLLRRQCTGGGATPRALPGNGNPVSGPASAPPASGAD